MPGRTHIHQETFRVSPEKLFEILMKPSAIREWWSAARVVINPREGGTWAAAWGDVEDDPDYVTAAKIRELDPPSRLVLSDYEYYAKEGDDSFDMEFTTEFLVEPADGGAMLRVSQEGFPEGPGGDEFLSACKKGWEDTFAGIRRYLES